MTSTLTPHDILRKFYGYHSFRAHQLEIIEGVCAGRTRSC